MTSVKHGMSHWYDPIPLARVAIRVVISTVFGAFADRRELVAAVNPVASHPFDGTHDYSQRIDDKGDFWFDFIADTGDGWASTRAVAQVASGDVIRPDGQDDALPRGHFLVMGGDQVYPTASHKAYQERLVRPWESAAAEVPHAPGSEADWTDLGDLYAIPGNHDWYDGLIAFSHLFARRTYAAPHLASMARTGKIIARRQTRQVRSYFALKLPHGWWMWGTDSQLEGFIDQPQVDFFRYVASHWMEPGSKLILCVGQPSWTYVDPADPHKAFNSFSFLSRLATEARGADAKNMGHQLRLVLTGDAHHYSRYVEDDVHYVTAGGGGAFLHPTHHLRDHVAFEWEAPPPNQPQHYGDGDHPRHFALAHSGEEGERRAAIYPAARDSRMQSLKALAFAAYNPGFVVLYALFYGLLLWALDARSGAQKAGMLLSRLEAAGDSFTGAVSSLLGMLIYTPVVVILLLLTWGIYIYFADWQDRMARRIVAGSIHALGHAAIFVALTAAILPAYGRHMAGDGAAVAAAASERPSEAPVASMAAGSLPAEAGQKSDKGSVPKAAGDGHALLSGALVAIAAALASASWFGLYLLLSLNLFGRHWNEAFSAIRIRHFKNMLRMRISAEGLTLYPVGIRHVPGTDVPARDIATELIEPPVRIS